MTRTLVLILLFTLFVLAQSQAACGSIPNPANGFSDCANKNVTDGGSCYILCLNGLESGSATRICQNGIFSGTPAVCKAPPSASCPGIASPTDGTSDCDGNTVAHGASCYVLCTYGLDSGDATRFCNNGNFNGTVAVCKAPPMASCSPLASPPNGNSDCANAASVAHGSSCYVTCTYGVKSGDLTRFCINGNFNGTEAVCNEPPMASCSPIASPPNGVSGCTSGSVAHGASCYITCTYGVASGDLTRFCINGVFNGTEAVCNGPPMASCSALANPVDGTSGCANAPVAHGDSCTLTCTYGVASGDSTRFCINGTFNGTDIVCNGPPMANCQPIASPPNGVSYCPSADTNHGDSCTVACTYGVASGDLIRVCINGEFNGTVAVCNPPPMANCQPMASPPNGVSYCTSANTNHGDSCTVACTYGVASGDLIRFCINGTFNGTVPVCNPPPMANCQPIASPPNGVSYCPSANTNHGDSCTIACTYGVASGDLTRFCINGTFNGTDVVCNPPPLANCQPIASPPNGVSYCPTGSTNNGESCSVTCTYGVASGDLMRFCINGTFNGTVAVCNPPPMANCQPIASPPNGVSYCPTANTNHGDSCAVACTYGVASGDLTRFCINGVFNGTAVVCNPPPMANCQPIASPPNGVSYCPTANTNNGDSCTVTCTYGKASGDLMRFCINGTFNGTVAVCNPPPMANCQPIASPPNGVSYCPSSNTNNGDSCTVACTYGKSSGDLIRFCINGVFNGTAVVCNPPPLGCQGLANPTYGSSACASQTVAHGQSCALSCLYGLTSGSLTRFCINGNFNGTATVCNAPPAASCLPIASPPNGVSYCPTSNTSNGASCTVSCQYGVASGSATRTCVNGVFNGTAVVCNPPPMASCQGLASPQYGSSSCEGMTVAHGESCNLMCPSGVVSGSICRVCINGTFNGTATVCYPPPAGNCIGLSSPPYGASYCVNETVAAGDICLVGCTYGIVSGDVSRTCQQNGSFSGYPLVCMPPPNCTGLASPLYGQSSCENMTVAAGSVCQITCPCGAAVNRTCLTSGEWDGDNTTCAAPATCAPLPCPPLASPPNGESSCAGQTTADGSECAINCAFGVDSGDASRLCVNGTFSGIPTVCKNDTSQGNNGSNANATCDMSACEDGTYFDASYCSETDNGCQDCSPTICEGGQFFVVSQCRGNQTGCKTCSEGECGAGTFFNSSQCSGEHNGCIACPAVANCAGNVTCPNGMSICPSCSYGYTLMHGSNTSDSCIRNVVANCSALANPTWGQSFCPYGTPHNASCRQTCLYSNVSVNRLCMNGTYSGQAPVCVSPCNPSPCGSQQTCLYDRSQTDRGCRCENVAPTYGVVTVIVIVVVVPARTQSNDVARNVHSCLSNQGGIDKNRVGVSCSPVSSNNQVSVSILCFPDSTGNLSSSEWTAQQVLMAVNSQAITYPQVGEAEVTDQRSVSPTDCNGHSGWSDGVTSLSSCDTASASAFLSGYGVIILAVCLILVLGLIVGLAFMCAREKRKLCWKQRGEEGLPQPVTAPA